MDFVFCGSQLTDSRKRTKLNGKVSDLPDTISSVLNVPLSNINLDGYIYNERSYRDLRRLEKILEDAKSLQPQSFTTNNRTKRCVPSDSRISPSVSAPSKSLPQAMDQGRIFCFDVIISATIFARRKSTGGNKIGLNQKRKSHAASRSFEGSVRAHFPQQRLVIEPIKVAAKKTSIFNCDTSHIFKSSSILSAQEASREKSLPSTKIPYR